MPFVECVKAEIDHKAFVDVNGNKVRIREIKDDVYGGTHISEDDLTIQEKLGEVCLFLTLLAWVLTVYCKGGFGVVHRALLEQTNDEQEQESLVVAVKELRSDGTVESFYEFQHEVAIMR